MNSITRLLRWLSTLTMALGCAATLLMMAHVSADVLGRLLFRRPIQGTLEVVTYLYMVAVVFLPLPMVQRMRQQIIVELFSQIFPKRVLAALDGSMAVICFAFMVLLTWYSGHDAWAQTLIRETAPSELNPVPIWPARWFVTIGAALAACYLAIQAVHDLGFAISGRRFGDEDAAHTPTTLA